MAIVGEALKQLLIARVRNDELHFRVRTQAFFHLAVFGGVGEFQPVTIAEANELAGVLNGIAPRNAEGQPTLPTD